MESSCLSVREEDNRGTTVWDWWIIVDIDNHSDVAYGMYLVFCSILLRSLATWIVVLFGLRLSAKWHRDRLKVCLNLVVDMSSYCQREWWSRLCFVFYICSLSLISSPQSITYHPYLDSSRSPPTRRRNSYHIDTDCSVALMTTIHLVVGVMS